MADKTLGQVAQKRWREARDAGLLQDDAWQAAAEAVVAHWKMYDEPPPVIRLETTIEQQAVIDAAVRWEKQFPAGKPAHELRWTTTTALLWQAVDAYLKARGE